MPDSRAGICEAWNSYRCADFLHICNSPHPCTLKARLFSYFSFHFHFRTSKNHTYVLNATFSIRRDVSRNGRLDYLYLRLSYECLCKDQCLVSYNIQGLDRYMHGCCCDGWCVVHACWSVAYNECWQGSDQVNKTLDAEHDTKWVSDADDHEVRVSGETKRPTTANTQQ